MSVRNSGELQMKARKPRSDVALAGAETSPTTNEELASAALVTLARIGISIRTVQELIGNRHTAGIYCPDCAQWADMDLRGLVALGLGDRPVATLSLRCRDCGTPAHLHVRPPVPQWAGASWGATT